MIAIDLKSIIASLAGRINLPKYQGRQGLLVGLPRRAFTGFW